MKKYILLCTIIVSVFSLNGYAQKEQVAAADKKYNNFAYIDARETYERIAEKGYKSIDMFRKLGNSYYFNSEFEKAAKWYKELFAMSSDQDSEYYYRYAQSLKSINKNLEANKMLEIFYEKASDDSRAILFKNNENYLDDIKANSGRYTIKNAEINSEYSDYGSAIYDNKLVFASSRSTQNLRQKKHKWTDQYFTNLYESDLSGGFDLGKIHVFSKTINSKFNESTPTFTKDGKTMYFTRNNYLNGKKGGNKNEIILVKIYKATFKNNKWGNITELPFDSDQYSTAHPALSPDEKTLYFASDMPGTLGQSDLFKVLINDNGTYGTPENLGKSINTEGKETFPYLSAENELYFASDGHPGLGGLDIFVSKINTDGTYSTVQNVGEGINSNKDDFAFYIDVKSRSGFITSNRDGGKGYDDLYQFKETRKLFCKQELFGTISDLNTTQPIPEVKVTLFDNQFTIVSTTKSDRNGNYSFDVTCGKSYKVRTELEEYTTQEQKIVIPTVSGKTELPFVLEKAIRKVVVGSDLGKYLEIKMIYFDLDKDNIRPEAAFELEKILDILNNYPMMKISIRSHTDCRATTYYNEVLSNKRAKSTMKWLIQNGIASSRLTSKGYGETQPIVICNDCDKCTEAQHQQNRRSEFIITGL